VKRLLGRNDIEDALKRLDTLTMEEARMAITEIRMDVKEVHAVVQRSANDADEEKRSCFDLTPVDSKGLFSSQRASYERNCKSGSLLQIPRQITISHARHITRERHPGFSKAEFSKSGSCLLHSCGSMENVWSFSSPLLHTPLTPTFAAGSGKSVLWFVCFFLLLLPGSTQIIAQLWDN
jgi:hypothetical protein